MSERVRLEVDGLDKHVNQLKAVSQALAGAVIEAALAGGQVIADRANANLDKGEMVIVELNASETTAQRAVVDIGLKKDAWYLRFFETGTSPHEVYPKTAAALRWFADQKPVFSAGHLVDGMPANPFMRPAIDGSGQAVSAEMAGVYDRRIKRAVS